MKKAAPILNAFEQVGDFLLGVWGAFEALFLNRRPVERIVSRRPLSPVQVDERALTVLAIDDDALYLSAVNEMLQEKGWKVLSAANAAKGLEILRHASDQIDVVLLDYDMPNLQGDVTLEHMRKLCPDIKVIAATGMEVQGLPVTFREGVDDILGKPFTSGDLIGCIRSLANHPRGGMAASSVA